MKLNEFIREHVNRGLCPSCEYIWYQCCCTYAGRMRDPPKDYWATSRSNQYEALQPGEQTCQRSSSSH